MANEFPKFTMSDDPKANQKAVTDDEEVRTRDAKRVVEDYARGLRDMLEKLRRLFH